MGKPVSKKVRAKLKVPYRFRDLKSADNFISYCEKNGLKTSKEELEYFDKQSLLIPAVLIDHGIAGKYYLAMAKRKEESDKEWKNQYIYEEDLEDFDIADIDDEPYFGEQGLSMGRDELEDYYNKFGAITYPCEHEFVPWGNWKVKSKHSWSKDPNSVKQYTPCYSVYQMYCLKLLKDNRRIYISNDGLFRDEKRWIKAGKNIRERFEEFYSDDYLRPYVCSYYNFFEFYLKVLGLYFASNDAIREKYEETLDDFDKIHDPFSEAPSIEEIKKEAVDFAYDFGDTTLKKKLKQDIEALMVEHDFSLKDLKNWRHKILQLSRLYQFRFPRTYIAQVSSDVMVQTEQSCFHAMWINNFLEILEGERRQVQQVILDLRVPLCPICQSRPIRTKKDGTLVKNAVTCGKGDCPNISRLRLKAKKRGTGEYK